MAHKSGVSESRIGGKKGCYYSCFDANTPMEYLDHESGKWEPLTGPVRDITLYLISQPDTDKSISVKRLTCGGRKQCECAT